MRVDVSTGLLVGVKQVLSPHFDARPAGVEPDLVILHGISLPPGEYGGPWIARLFTAGVPPDVHPFFETLQGLRVSAHVLIRRDGEPVQFVSFNERAWHAGGGRWGTITDLNSASIGIELDNDGVEPFTELGGDSPIDAGLRGGVR